eukprot:3385947-Rhodomonas_salina.3
MHPTSISHPRSSIRCHARAQDRCPCCDLLPATCRISFEMVVKEGPKSSSTTDPNRRQPACLTLLEPPTPTCMTPAFNSGVSSLQRPGP